MCKKILQSALFILVLMAQAAFGQQAKVMDEVIMPSKILKMERKFAIYLPPDYETSNRKYPVLYLLHGLGDDQTGWVQFGEVLNIATKAIENGTSTAMIIVMPDANTGKVGYANSADQTWLYEDFFFQELIPYVESHYRCKAEKRFRAIAGLSMGGWGTFVYALHRPDMFAAACPLSAYCGPMNVTEARKDLIFDHSMLSDEQVSNFYYKYGVLPLIDSVAPEKKNAVRWYIDCGDDDFLYEGNSLVHIAMKKKEINHEFRIRNGAHNWSYWRESLPTVLEFVSMSFHQY